MKALIVGLLIVTTLVLGAPAPSAHAASQANCLAAHNNSFFGLPNWYKYLERDFSDGQCNINFNIESDIPKILLAVFEIILRIGGLVAVAFVIVGGVQYTISQGEPDKTNAAKKTIINALVGLFIALMAVSIVNLVGGIVK